MSFDELAGAADCIMAYEAGQNKANVRYVKNESSSLRQLAAGDVLNKRRKNNSISNVPLGIRAFHEKHRPMGCRPHIYLISKAKT